MENIPKKKRINWLNFRISLIHNGFASFILGFFPTLMAYYIYPPSEFKEILNCFIPRGMIFAYLTCITCIGVFLKIYYSSALKDCATCEKSRKLQDLPNIMVQPLMRIYNILSGLLVAGWVIGLVVKQIFISTLLGFVGLGILIGISFVDSIFLSADRN